MQGAERLRAKYAPTHPLMGGGNRNKITIFVDDCMFLDALMGTRAEQSVVFWERTAGMFLRTTAISQTKLVLEGQWPGEVLPG